MNAPECREALFKVRTDTILTIKGKRDKIQDIIYEFLVSNGYPVVAQVYDEALKEIDQQCQNELLQALTSQS